MAGADERQGHCTGPMLAMPPWALRAIGGGSGLGTACATCMFTGPGEAHEHHSSILERHLIETATTAAAALCRDVRGEGAGETDDRAGLHIDDTRASE